MRSRIFAIVTMAAIASGCAVGGMEDEWQTEVRDGTLHLDEATPERLRGTYSRNGASIAFEATRLSDGMRTLVVKSNSLRDGRTLVHATGSGSSRVLSVLDDRLVSNGDHDALSQLFAVPDAAALPWLSRELGKRGITGREYPVSFELHSLALVVGKAHDVSLPPLVEETKTLRSETCSNAPGQDACFGMCGGGCSCWEWVCGDCCWHAGCAVHDADCRACSFTHPGACARCASFVGFFTGGGCDGD